MAKDKDLSTMGLHDFDWLYTQAGDNLTKQALDKIIAIEKSYKIGQPLHHGTGLVKLRLGENIIWTRENTSHSIPHGYVQIFKFLQEVLPQPFKQPMSQQIIDVGANEGHWSLFMRHLHPKSPILAIEPNPVPLELLQKNFAANHLSNATVLAIALAGKAEIREFETIDNVTGLGSFHIDRTGRPWLTPEKIKLIEVECRTLDQILQQQNLTPFIDILKVDVEGAELDVVRGAQLALQRVRRIQIEYGTESNRENLVRKLSDQGFKLLLDHKFSPGRGDLFFLSRALI